MSYLPNHNNINHLLTACFESCADRGVRPIVVNIIKASKDICDLYDCEPFNTYQDLHNVLKKTTKWCWYTLSNTYSALDGARLVKLRDNLNPDAWNVIYNKDLVPGTPGFPISYSGVSLTDEDFEKTVPASMREEILDLPEIKLFIRDCLIPCNKLGSGIVQLFPRDARWIRDHNMPSYQRNAVGGAISRYADDMTNGLWTNRGGCNSFP